MNKMHEFGKFSDLGINWHFFTTITAVLSEVVKYVKYGKKIVSFFASFQYKNSVVIIVQ